MSTLLNNCANGLSGVMVLRDIVGLGNRNEDTRWSRREHALSLTGEAAPASGSLRIVSRRFTEVAEERGSAVAFI